MRNRSPLRSVTTLRMALAVVSIPRFFCRCRSNPDGTTTARPIEPGTEPVGLDVEVVSTLPHDTTSFTQGLIRVDGGFYESTGLRGQSTLRRVDLATGERELLAEAFPPPELP